MLKRISRWWNKKSKTERKNFILKAIVALMIAIALMTFGSIINFSVTAVRFKTWFYIAIGLVIGYLLGQYSTAEDDEEGKR